MANVCIAGVGPATNSETNTGAFPNTTFTVAGQYPSINITSASTFYSVGLITPADANQLVFGAQVQSSFSGTPGLTVALYGTFTQSNTNFTKSYTQANQPYTAPAAYTFTSTNFIAGPTITLSSTALAVASATTTTLFPYWQVVVTATTGTGLLNFYLYFTG